jgi:aspartate kinase
MEVIFMIVMKFGGSCLGQPEGFNKVADIVASDKRPRIVVISAVHGITSMIEGHLASAHADEESIQSLLDELKVRHVGLIQKAIKSEEERGKLVQAVDRRVKKMERLLYGVAYTEELTPRTRDLLMSFGERLSAPILAACLRDRDVQALAFDTDRTGLITDGEFGNATANLSAVSLEFARTMVPKVKEGMVPILTGYFGADPEGRVTTFGRGGSDYSAAVVAYAVDAEVLEIWKDVEGFMTSDPKVIPGARTIDRLSYQEAAELAYFGAKVLHPRSVEPVMQKGIPIHIRSIDDPKDPGTLIVGKGYEAPRTIKSVAFTKDIAALKVYGAGVGYKLGVLNKITTALKDKGINIKSVITAQTCISLLVEKRDLEPAYKALEKANLNVVEELERVSDIALVGIVGEGLVKTPGLAAKAFTAVASAGVNVEMISAGASRVAYYFIIKEKDLERTVKAVHGEFFHT